MGDEDGDHDEGNEVMMIVLMVKCCNNGKDGRMVVVMVAMVIMKIKWQDFSSYDDVPKRSLLSSSLV